METRIALIGIKVEDAGAAERIIPGGRPGRRSPLVYKRCAMQNGIGLYALPSRQPPGAQKQQIILYLSGLMNYNKVNKKLEFGKLR